MLLATNPALLLFSSLILSESNVLHSLFVVGGGGFFV